MKKHVVEVRMKEAIAVPRMAADGLMKVIEVIVCYSNLICRKGSHFRLSLDCCPVPVGGTKPVIPILARVCTTAPLRQDQSKVRRRLRRICHAGHAGKTEPQVVADLV